MSCQEGGKGKKNQNCKFYFWKRISCIEHRRISTCFGNNLYCTALSCKSESDTKSVRITLIDFLHCCTKTVITGCYYTLCYLTLHRGMIHQKKGIITLNPLYFYTFNPTCILGTHNVYFQGLNCISLLCQICFLLNLWIRLISYKWYLILFTLHA